jgi:5-methylcytosine-specific restriction endonuclease McrA
MARHEFSRKIKAAAIARSAGKCERCSATLKPGEAECDHVLPDALGGEPTLANCMVLCRTCHRGPEGKTTQDIRRVRKADRQRDKHSGAVKPAGKIASRPKETRPATKQALAPRQLYKEIAS